MRKWSRSSPPNLRLSKSDWRFVIADVVTALTDSIQATGYIKNMRKRDSDLNKGWGQIASPLSVPTPGGIQKLNCANTEGIFRVIQSIPSPKAEPFKKWLAKGYPDDWIENECIPSISAKN
jgi:prophage antirepressor-like protein